MSGLKFYTVNPNELNYGNVKIIKSLFGAEGIGWLYMLRGFIATADGCTIDINDREEVQNIATYLGISPAKFFQFISALKRVDIIKILDGRYVTTEDIQKDYEKTLRHRTSSNVYYKKTNNISLNGHTKAFKEFCEIYPKFVETKIAWQVWRKSDVPEEDLLNAAKSYKAICDKERRDPKYVMNPVNFINSRWESFKSVSVNKKPEKEKCILCGHEIRPSGWCPNCGLEKCDWNKKEEIEWARSRLKAR